MSEVGFLLFVAIASLILGVLTSLFGVIQNLLTDIAQNFLNRLLGKPQKQQAETYSEKVSRLTNNLSKATEEVDEVLKEIAVVSRERTKTVAELEKQLEELATREKRVKERIEVLEKVPLEAVQHFEKMLDKGEKRSAWRDYTLFGLGVIVSTAIAIGLKLIGF